MAKVEIMERELIWDVFNANTYKKIGSINNGIKNDVYFDGGFDEKILKKMYPVFHSKFTKVPLENFIKYYYRTDCWTSVGENYDYNTIEDFKQVQPEKKYLFYIKPRYVIRKKTVNADYFDVQEPESSCENCIMAAFPNYESAVKYCNKENISIYNIIPRRWGHHESLD